MRLNLERERLEFEKSRAERLDKMETQRIELMNRQQEDNTKVQMKMMSVCRKKFFVNYNAKNILNHNLEELQSTWSSWEYSPSTPLST